MEHKGNAVNTVEGFKNAVAEFTDAEGLDADNASARVEVFFSEFGGIGSINYPYNDEEAFDRAMDMVIDEITEFRTFSDVDEYFRPIVQELTEQIGEASDELRTARNNREFRRNHQPPY